MHRSLRRLLGFLLASACAAGTHAASLSMDTGTKVVEPREQTRAVTEGLAKAGTMRAAHAHVVRLAAPGPGEALGRPSKGAPLQIGFARAIPALRTEEATSTALEWEALSDGSHVADLSIASTGAAAVRAGLRIGSLPNDALLRFKGPGDETLFEMAGDRINEAIARNVAAGDAADDARTYWSPVIEGDTIVVEIELGARDDPIALHVAVPQVSHLVRSAGTAFSTPTLLGQSSSCEIDAMCSSGTNWANQRNAVAEMIFTDASGTFLCTGTLLADEDASTNRPYFLTANHCVNTTSAASSLSTYWFYRSASCGSSSPGAYQQLLGGATLLYNTTSTDTSFMLLNNTPPQGTFFAGWVAGATPGTGTAITGLHQPAGDLLKISQGTIGGYLTCTAPGGNGSFSCSNASSSSSTFYDVGWTSGLTEPGSSGSGLFVAGGYLIGQLYGGSSSCPANPTDEDVYGRFDIAYNAALKTWLSPPLTLAVTKSGAGTGTVTSAPAGIGCGSTCSASFAPGTSVTLNPAPDSGSVFAGWGGACSGTGACTVSMNAPQGVSASFESDIVTLSISTSGSGAVTSSPAGIDCGSTCSASFAFGTAVALTPTPAAGSIFSGWSGACSGTGSCVVGMNGARSVAAAFVLPPPTDLGVSQSLMQDPTAVGSELMFTITVTDNGPNAATGVIVSDSLPAGVTFVAASSGCANSSTTVTCNVGSLSSGASAVVNVVVRPTSAGTVTNTASVSGLGVDSATANNTSSIVATVVATPTVKLAAISTRMEVLTGGNVLIGGFIVGGPTAKTVIVRARGPSLASFGISNVLANPVLQLVRAADNSTIGLNDDWGSASNAAQMSASGLAPSDPRESAILMTLAPGAYTAIVSGAGGGTGVGIVEVYEVDHPEVPLTAISTRGEVLGGANVMIGGFIIQGSSPLTVVVRARGPSLLGSGITNALGNPMLQLVRASDNSTIAANDDWVNAANAAKISVLGFAPSHPLESAILITLDPGAYTAIVSGAAGATGVGIVEVYVP